MFRKLLSKSRGAISKAVSNETLSTEDKNEKLDLTCETTTEEIDVNKSKIDSNIRGLMGNEETDSCAVDTIEKGSPILQCSVIGDLETLSTRENQYSGTSNRDHQNSWTEVLEEKTKDTKEKVDVISVKELDVSENSFNLETDITMEDNAESSHLYCQPCSEKKENRAAEIWCTQCHETLCGNCNSHHAVFKATRNHVVISIHEYEAVLFVLKDTPQFCTDHPEKPMEEFCVQHNQPFCFSCQRNSHQGCDIRQIDQMIGTPEHISNFDQSFERMKNCNRFLKEMFENHNSTKTSLVDARERFLIDLKVNRSAVNDWLDRVENEACMQFEQAFLSEKDIIEKQSKEFDNMRRGIQERSELCVKLAPFKTNPTNQMFLAMLQTINDTEKEYDNLKNQQESFYSITLDGKISFEIIESDKTVKMINNFKFIQSPCNIRIDDTQMYRKDDTQIDRKDDTQIYRKDDTQIDRKDDTQIYRKDDTQIDRKDDTQIYRKDDTHSITDDEILTSSSVVEEECENFLDRNSQQEHAIEDKPVSIESTLSNTDSDSEITSNSSSDSDEYHMRHSFYVQKSVSAIELVDVTVLQNNELAILETSTPRLLVYEKDGKKKRGQVLLSDTPSNLTVYRDNEVAITLPKLQNVAIISASTLTLYRYIEVKDECHGICMTNNQLVVSCVNHGLKLVDCNGTIRRIISKLKGHLYICNGGDGNVFTMKQESKMVVRYNINNNRRSNFHVGGSYEPRGITVDDEDNLLFSCSQTDGIYKKEDTNTSSEIIISDGIRNPSRLCFDKENNEIVVINNDGKSLSTYVSYYQGANRFCAW